jgi:hypothetical protein
MNKAEIVVYRDFQNPDFQMEVRVENETVWLNRQQLAELFGRDIKTIGKHINNALREELKTIPVIAKIATTASDGKTYQVEHYNLDMIISIGYRVKSERGIQFRKWANKVLKDHLLSEHFTNYRLEKIERKLVEHDEKFELIFNSGPKAKEGIFFEGQVFDAWQFTSRLIKEANKSIILMDNYIDESVLHLLSKRKRGVSACIYTRKISQQLKTDLKKHNQQYPAIELKQFSKSHDRFLILDEKEIYHIGASIKDLGKRWFAFSKINIDPKAIIDRLI